MKRLGTVGVFGIGTNIQLVLYIPYIFNKVYRKIWNCDCDTHVSHVIEGDELYTQLLKNQVFLNPFTPRSVVEQDLTPAYSHTHSPMPFSHFFFVRHA